MIDGPAGIRAFRQDVAKVINDVAAEFGIELEAAWHGGRLRETGIDRPAKARVPVAVFKARSGIELRNDGPRQTSELIDRGEFEQARAVREAWRQRAADEAALKRAEREAKRAEAELRGRKRNERGTALIVREPRTQTILPLKPDQRKLLEDVAAAQGIELPADIDTNPEAQSALYESARSMIRQEAKRRAMREQKRMSVPHEPA